MKTILFASLLATGCQYVLGFEDTKLRPDAPPIDVAPDAPPGPPIFVGDGADGALTVTGVTYTDEVRATLSAEVGANSTLIKVSSVDGFNPGDEVLIMQMAGENAGQYETHEIAATQPGQLLLGTQLRASYLIGATGQTQIIRVPNHTDVTILDGGVLTAHAWDGNTGGVVMFRAKGKLHVQSGGALVADALGHAAGTGGLGGTGGPGGDRGYGGGKEVCVLGNCGADLNAGPGGYAATVSALGAPGQAGAVANKCRGGRGGNGGLRRENSDFGDPGLPGSGIGAGATPDTPGTNLSANVNHPLLGGGGAGGSGGASGRGAGGGGGGGGPVSSNNNGTGGTNGTVGEAGGDGGNGGDGGRGGGIVIVHAQTIELAGRVSARGVDGSPATSGTDGGTGGTGGFDGSHAPCGTSYVYGGRGGGGEGGDGGNGGSGGGGGGGGIVELVGFDITAGGELKALGGVGGMPGAFGLAGAAGDGYDDPDNPDDGAKPGSEGLAGLTGGTGGNGFLYLRYADSCSACNIGEPAAIVMKL